MQAFERPKEKRPTQEQWETMENNGKNNGKYNVLTHRLVISAPHKNKSPAAERRRAHRSKTRISAIAHRLAERTLKSVPVIPAELSNKLAIRTHPRSPWPLAEERTRKLLAVCRRHYFRRAVTSISTFISALSRPATTSIVEAGRTERRRSPPTCSTGS